MKFCPICKKTYSDNTLQFCLEDGAALSPLMTEQPTEQFSGTTNPIRVSIERDETPTIVRPITPPETEQRKGRGWNLVYGLILGFIGSMLLGAVMFGGMLYWQRNQKTEIVSNTPTTPTPANSIAKPPTPDESAILKEKIANLEKKVQEQKNTKLQVPTISNSSIPQTNKVTAKANSPGDGFLALRSAPSSETGERILKIPHGATLTVIECLPKAPGKNGRWCRVDYNGNLGWAFDGYMIYR